MTFRKSSIILIILAFTLFSIIISIALLHQNETSSLWSMSIGSENGTEVYQTDYDPSNVGENFGVGLYNYPNHTPENSMGNRKYIGPNESFSGYLYVNNQMYSANDFLIFCLVDYNQTEFVMESNPASIHHQVHFKPMEERMIEFRVPPMSEGIHDVELFLIMKPFDHSLDKEFRLKTDMSLLGSRRANVYVGNNSRTEMPVFRPYKGPSQSCGKDYVLNDGHMVTSEPCGRTAWFSREVSHGDIVDYWVNAAANTKYPVSVALVPLVDYYQITFRNSSSEKAIFLNLAAGEKISIPGQVIIPEDKGVHEFMVLWIPKPYSNLDDGEEKKQWITSEPSIRLGLNSS
jgi:hypothetical protein